MRILHVLDHSVPLHSGYTFRTLNILQEQRARGWDIACVTTPKHTAPSPPVEVVEDFTFHRTLMGDSLASKIPVLNELALISATADTIEQVIQEKKPDIIHAHSPALTGVAAVRAGRKHAIPVVYECRAFWEDAAVDHGTASEWGLRYRATRWLESWVFQNANAVTTICEGLRSEIAGRGIPQDKITVIPNAVDIDRFAPLDAADAALKKQLGLDDGMVLGFLGSFYAYEGLEFLVRAMPALLKAVPGVKLLLVGGGPQEQLLKKTVSGLGLDGQVVFTGRVPHAEVDRYYGLIDLLVFPRLPMRLTELVTPLKPLEAMAQKKLVLASDVGGHHELIKHGETGFLFAKNDAQDLVRQIGLIRSLPDLQERVKVLGRKFVETERNWTASVARYEKVYGGLLPAKFN